MELLERTEILRIHTILSQIQPRWNGQRGWMTNEYPSDCFTVMSVWVLATKEALQGHSEELPEVSSNQQGGLGGSRAGPICLAKNGKKTGATINKANRIATVKVKRMARKSQTQKMNAFNAQALLTFLRCQRTLRARIGLVSHMRTQMLEITQRGPMNRVLTMMAECHHKFK
ncbi:unnamed protein product [Dibothriocephalus latus]|uniref:Uncharacterized protein n=1 Tax=Dibothriocephalus latus TaxID=60516 RepID=A0A3P7L2S7_DIBLA|nr:unnamed protein product [Dibothriocephalus latus]